MPKKNESTWPINGRVTRAKAGSGKMKPGGTSDLVVAAESSGTSIEGEKEAAGSGKMKPGGTSGLIVAAETSGTSIEGEKKAAGCSYAKVAGRVPQNPGVQTPAENVPAEDVTVYLEPCETDRAFPRHPVELARILTERNFKAYRDITMIGRFRFKIDAENEEAANRLKSLTLTAHNIKIYSPNRGDKTILFVKGVPEDFGEGELKDVTSADTEVLSVERIKKRRNEVLVNTTNLRITVSGGKVPGMVKIYGCAFKCELYIFPIRQCLKCWRFGHSAKKCTSKVRCRICSKGHKEEDCGAPDHCPNCRGPHRATSKECPERDRRQKILDTMKRRQINYKEAEAGFPKLSNQYSALEEETGENAEAYPRLGTTRKRQSSTTNSNNNETKDTTEAGTGDSTRPERAEEGGCKCQENPFRTTDFERFVDKLRKEFLAETRNHNWIHPLKMLHTHIVNKVQEETSEIDRDQLIIDIANRIKDIVERNTTTINKPRTAINNNSGV